MTKRLHNERRVVQSIFGQGTATQQTICRDAKLSRAAVSSILGSLEQRGFVQRGEEVQSRAGRPATTFLLTPRYGMSIGVALGSDAFRLVLVDSSKRLVGSEVHRLHLSGDPAHHAEEIVERLARAIGESMRGIPIRDELLSVAVGVSLLGMVDADRGEWMHGIQLSEISHVNVRNRLSDLLKLPVTIEEHSRALAFYEKHLGAARNLRDFVLLYLDFGVGSSIVTHGRMYRGVHGLAGEIGHYQVERDGYRCGCGKVGCLETVVSSLAIVRRFRDRLREGVRSALQRQSRTRFEALSLDGSDSLLGDACLRLLQEIGSAADGGDRLAVTTLQEIGSYLGGACAILIQLLNPEKLIVAGSVAVLGRHLKDSIMAVVRQESLSDMLQDTEICFSEYQPYNQAYGVALLAFENALQGTGPD